MDVFLNSCVSIFMPPFEYRKWEVVAELDALFTFGMYVIFYWLVFCFSLLHFFPMMSKKNFYLHCHILCLWLTFCLVPQYSQWPLTFQVTWSEHRLIYSMMQTKKLKINKDDNFHIFVSFFKTKNTLYSLVKQGQVSRSHVKTSQFGPRHTMLPQ